MWHDFLDEEFFCLQPYSCHTDIALSTGAQISHGKNAQLIVKINVYAPQTGKGPLSFEYRFFRYFSAALNVKHPQMLSCTNKFIR